MNFYCFEMATDPVLVGFSAKCTSSSGHCNPIENWKCYIFNFRLIFVAISSHVFLATPVAPPMSSRISFETDTQKGQNTGPNPWPIHTKPASLYLAGKSKFQRRINIEILTSIFQRYIDIDSTSNFKFRRPFDIKFSTLKKRWKT